MDFKKIAKIIAVIAALCAIGAAVYFAIKKLTAKEKPEYFDDNDFFECDNDLEVIDVADEAEEPAEEIEEAVEEAEEEIEEEAEEEIEEEEETAEEEPAFELKDATDE